MLLAGFASVNESYANTTVINVNYTRTSYRAAPMHSYGPAPMYRNNAYGYGGYAGGFAAGGFGYAGGYGYGGGGFYGGRQVSVGVVVGGGGWRGGYRKARCCRRFAAVRCRGRARC